MIKNCRLQIFLKFLIIISFVILTILIFCHKSNLTSLDLGRHIKNGEIIWQNTDVLYTNFYSYTEPFFPFINHHWFSGVIFYWLYLLGGFKILTLFNILVALLTIVVTFLHAQKKSNFYFAAIIILPVILILSERTNIRPEMFSVLFLALEFYFLDKWRSAPKKDNKYLYYLIPLHFAWVNLHIYFFLGLFILSLVLLEQVIVQIYNFKKKLGYWKLLRVWSILNGDVKKVFYITMSCYFVSLINPNFIKNLLYPFNILKKYGYQVAENKSPFYLDNITVNYNIFIFKILLVILILSFILYFYTTIRLDKLNENQFIIQLKKGGWFNFIISIFFTGLAFFAIRNLPIFALIIAPVIAYNLKIFWNRIYFKNIVLIIILCLYLVIIFNIIKDYNNEQKFVRNNFGIGLSSGSEDSIKFYKNNKLKGPIFNNYDFGSALDFWIYPKEQVFVDNRPEAYSINFFNNVYKPMQQSEEKWKELSEKYNINLIYFSHTDGTPWAQQFLRKILHNNNWSLIYFDQFVVILVKNVEENFKLIREKQISSQKFESNLKELTIESKNNIRNQISLANLAIYFNRIDLAKNIFENILLVQPENSKALASLGFLLSNSSRKSDLNKSIYLLKKAIENGYKLPSIYNKMGLVYWNLNEYSQAKNMWEKSIKIDKDNAHALDYLKQSKGQSDYGA